MWKYLIPIPSMTVQEVAVYLKLAESTVYKLAREGKLPGQKFGGAWRFSREQIDAWLAKTIAGKFRLLNSVSHSWIIFLKIVLVSKRRG